MMDPLAALLDEVSLEGLDGVTLETLWLRLSARRPAFPLQLEPRVQQYLWNVLACSPDVTFHLLPRARAPLHLHDRFSDIDPETGIQDVRPLDTEVQPEDPYPVSVLVDDPQGIQGSCLYFRERKDITHLIRTSQHTPVLTLEQAQKQYGEKLVLVASQELRYRALIGDEGNPELKLSDYSYCILERLGRARWQGEIQRDLHISSFKLDAGKVHYLRKSLDRNGLITMQSHVVRLPTGVRQHSILLLLKRFHVDRRSKYDILMESTSNLLSELPNNIGIMLRLREQLQVGEHTFKRVYQYMQAAKVVSVLTIPLQELNPEAGPCKTKRGTDIRVRCLKLLRPYTRKETYDDDDDENNDEDADGLDKRNVQAQARDIERDLLTQAYEIVVANGPKGISQSVLRGRLNIGRLESRMVCKVLERNNMIKGFMEDEGRQRTTKYISKLFVEKSNLNLRFAKELERSEKLRVPTNDSTDPGSGPCPDPEDQDDSLCNDPETEQDPQEEEEEEEAHKGQKSKGKAGKKSKSAKKGSQRAVTSTPRHSTPLRKKPPPRFKETDQSTPEVEPSKIGKQEDTLLVPQDHTPSIPHSQSETADDTVPVVEEVVDELEQMSVKKRGHEQHETYRMLKRKNLIIEAVRNLKVIEGLYTLQKKLMDEEKQDGVSTKVCKKSIVRLTRSLSRDGYLKLFRTTVIQDGVSRKVEFVVHPSITPDDPLVKSAIEQVRFKISSSYTVHRLKKEEEKAKALAQDSKDDLQSESKRHRGKTERQMDVKELKDFKPTIVPGLSRSLGFQPKMPRFRMVHSFLFYLIYDHPFRQTAFNDPSLTDDATVAITADREENPATPSSSTERDGNTENPPTPAEDEQFKVYVNELSWKRFVPPLPVHREFGYGWALTSDVLISLPLSVYVQVIQINYKVDGLEDFLSDPVKQHYLIRFLPSNIKTQLLHRRKYFFSFYENLQKLCYMGLLQFGPMEKFMDKDQGFFYLKKRATIMDTTTCEPHYNLAMETRPFDRRHYTFSTAQDVENYWFDMLCVCLNTPLGVVRPRTRLSDGDGNREGDEPEVTVGAERYERLQYTLKGSCDVVDDGVTPGDGQGAGGLDSSFFSHLKRNWLWTTHLVSKPKKPGDSHTVRLRNLLSKHPLPKSVCAAIQAGVGGSTVPPPAFQEDDVQMDVEPSSRNQQVRGGKKNKRKRQKKESSKPAKRKRKVVSVRKHTLCQDETDRKALLRMTRQRVTWTHLEDSILMLCRVASHFLNRKIKKAFVGWNVVRDILHSELELSLDKTSLSVGRRSRYIMKNPQTQLNYRICLAEVYQDKALIETFMNRTNNYDDPKVCAEEFNEFVSALRAKFSSSYGSSDVIIPDTKEELFDKFKVYVIGEEPALRTKDVLTSVEDIHSLVLNNLIQSTLVLSSSQMKTCQSFQSFSLYSTYNSEVLQQAFLNCKKRGLVNRRRANKVLGPKKSRAVPFVPMSYQLSQHYYRYFTWRFPSTVYNEVYDLLEVLRQKDGVDRPNTFSFQQDKEKEEQKDIEEKEEERVNEESEKAEESNDQLEKAEGPGAGVERQQQEVPGIDPVSGDVEHPAVDPKESPGDVEHPAVDPKESPGDVEHPAVDPKESPGDVEHPAVGPKESPGDVEHPAVGPKESPGDVEHPAIDPKESPGDVEHPAIDPKESPGDVEHPAVDPKESPGDVEHPAVDPKESPGGVEYPAVDPKESPGGVEYPAVDPKESLGGVEYPAVDPKESPGGVEYPAVDPKEFPGGVEYPAVDPKESPGGVEYPAVDPKESPGGVEYPAVDPKEFPGDVEHPAVDPKTHIGGEDPSVDSALPSGNLREPALDPLLPPGDVVDSTVDSLVPSTDVEEMLTFPIDAPGGASLCCLSLMTLGLLTVDVSVPQQVVVVDSTLVDTDVMKSITKELDEEEEDEVEDERRGRFEVKARQASHTNYLLMRGYFVPGIISLRNMNSTDHIAVNSCAVKIRLRRTPAHTLFREADGALSVVTRSSVPSLPPSLSRVFKQQRRVSEQSFVDKLVPLLGYSNMDVEAVQALRAAVQKEAEFGIDRLELSRTFSHLEQVEHGRSRTLQQYIQDLIDAEELVEVGALSPRLVCVDSGAPWLLQCPTQVCDELVRAFSIPESLKRKLGFSRHQLGSHGPPAAKRPRQAMKTGTMKTLAMVTASADSAATETVAPETVAKETTAVKSTALDTTAATSVTIETASSIATVTASAETPAPETVRPGRVTIEISTGKSAAVETVTPETSTPGVVAMETTSVTEAIAPAGKCSAETLGGARSLPPDPPSSEAGLSDDKPSGATGSSLQKDSAAEPPAGEGADERSSEEEEGLSFVARPWRIVDGSLNRPVCKGMLEALLLHIMTNPGVPEPALLQHYSGVLQPVIVLDLLQVLLTLGCVKKRFTLNRPKASLFSRPSVPEVRSQGELGVVEDVLAFYEPTVDCSLRLAQVFPHETNWNKWVQLCVR
ncbi:hypothetical protein MHYP_G00105880 [Metynnis hypsauchen]